LQHDLSGRISVPQPAQVRLYADEIKPYRNVLKEQWMYLGLVAIPEGCYQTALSGLTDDREAANYEGEVHFVDLHNYSYAHIHNQKTLLAKRWVDRVLNDRQKVFHFYLLGLNLDNLQSFAFGRGREQPRNIYNRFFRASVAYTLKSFFGRTDLVVTHIFHDKSDLEHDDLFDWHTIWRLDQAEPGITFLVNNIQFIDSDHEKELAFPADSHFIQLCDVLLGGLSHCLDARTKKDGCCEVAECLLPLAERLTDPRQVRNPNSRYCHVRRLSMSFFPSKRLKLKELEDGHARQRSGFYIERRLLFKEEKSRQLRLSEL
jgi:hypothetical protein